MSRIKGNFENPREDIRNFLLSSPIRETPNASWMICNKKLKLFGLSQGCHASFPSFEENPGDFWIGSGFYGLPNQKEYVLKFWDFLCDQEKSPWRVLTRDIELILNSKKDPRGWILSPDSSEGISMKLIKNFAILTRTFHEHRTPLDFWNKLVEIETDPRDAFYLCRFFVLDDYGLRTSHNVHNGVHWALTESLDWEVFWNGHIYKNPNGSINGYFYDSHSKIRPFYNHFINDKSLYEVRSIKNSFGNTYEMRSYDLDKVLKVYYDWKKANNLPS